MEWAVGRRRRGFVVVVGFGVVLVIVGEGMVVVVWRRVSLWRDLDGTGRAGGRGRMRRVLVGRLGALMMLPLISLPARVCKGVICGARKGDCDEGLWWSGGVGEWALFCEAGVDSPPPSKQVSSNVNPEQVERGRSCLEYQEDVVILPVWETAPNDAPQLYSLDLDATYASPL